MKGSGPGDCGVNFYTRREGPCSWGTYRDRQKFMPFSRIARRQTTRNPGQRQPRRNLAAKSLSRCVQDRLERMSHYVLDVQAAISWRHDASPACDGRRTGPSIITRARSQPKAYGLLTQREPRPLTQSHFINQNSQSETHISTQRYSFARLHATPSISGRYCRTCRLGIRSCAPRRVTYPDGPDREPACRAQPSARLPSTPTPIGWEVGAARGYAAQLSRRGRGL